MSNNYRVEATQTIHYHQNVTAESEDEAGDIADQNGEWEINHDDSIYAEFDISTVELL